MLSCWALLSSDVNVKYVPVLSESPTALIKAGTLQKSKHGNKWFNNSRSQENLEGRFHVFISCNKNGKLVLSFSTISWSYSAQAS